MNRKENFIDSMLYYASIFFFLILIVSAKLEESSNKTDVVERKWLTQLFSNAKDTFHMDPMVNSQCLQDYNLFKINLEAQTGWAIRMLESSEWPLFGILSGTTSSLGNWDECLHVSLPYMQGKYCLIEGHYDFDRLTNNNSTEAAVEWPSDELVVWEILRMFENNPIRADRRTVQWALCIPSSCQNTDLEMSLRNVMYPIFRNQNLDFHLKVDQSSCHIKNETKFPREFHYAVIFFLVIISLVSLSTFCHFLMKTTKNSDFGDKVLIDVVTSFSLIRNTKHLMQYSKNRDFGFVYGLKVLSIMMVTFCHRRLYSLGFPNFNPESTELNFKKGGNYVQLTHLPFVDIFFMLTGFLTFHLEFASMSKHGFRYWFVAVIHRWIRLIPTFGAILIFLIYIFPYINDGPFWNVRVTQEINDCKASWWANLLAISNLVRTENQCLIVSWYMSVDMQLAVIGFGLLYLTSKNETWGLIAILLTFISGTFVTFVTAVLHKFHAILPVFINFLHNPNSNENFTHFYVGSYTRIGPYIIGILTALIVKSLKEKEYNFSAKQKFIGFMLIFSLSEGYQHLGYLIEFEFARSYNAFEHAFFAATHRSIFVLPSAFMLCVYFTSGFYNLDKLYENKMFAVLGRLTYTVFIVNTIIQLFHAASQRSLIVESTLINQNWWFVADITYSYIFGAIVHLLLEAPIVNLSKIIKRKCLK